MSLTIKCVDLFCGCGGMSLGFEASGFNIVAGIDNWKAAIRVYEKKVLLAKQHVLKISKGDVKPEREHHAYCGKYGEWRVLGRVCSNQMELLPETPPSVEAQKALCKSHVWYISHTCRWYDMYS